MVHPAIFEALVFSLMGFAGVSMGLLLGVRKIAPLAVLALGASIVFRVWTTFAAWSLGRPDLTWELWFWGSLAVVGIAAVINWRRWKEALGALVLFGTASVIALGSKYVFDIGERHHSDSANVLALAIVAIQGDMESVEAISNSYKRGIAYPLMLGLGPEGRILAGFTPLVFLIILLAASWLAWDQLGSGSSKWQFGFVLAAVFGFGLSVPMFRASMFYLNGHTLMGLAVLLLAAGLLLMRSQGSFAGTPAAFVLVGGVLGVTSRVEGVALVLAVVAAIAGTFKAQSLSERLTFFTVISLIGLSLPWWLVTLDSPALERVGVPGEILPWVALVGSALVSIPLVDRIRPLFLPIFSGILLFLLGSQVWEANEPLRVILTQWPNLGLGAGGWGTAAHVFVGSLVLLGWRARSHAYRWLVILVAVTLGAILYSKTFDGGFGGSGFYDSVNRMWLHAMPLITAMTLLGYNELVEQIRSWRRSGRDADVKAGAMPSPS